MTSAKSASSREITTRRFSGELNRAALADWGATIFKAGVAIREFEHIKDQAERIGNGGDITKVIRRECRVSDLMSRCRRNYRLCRSTAYQEVRRRRHGKQSRLRWYQPELCRLRTSTDCELLSHLEPQVLPTRNTWTYLHFP